MPMQSGEHVWILLRDGRKLSARLFLPQLEGAYPVIIEYNPYRCHDITYEFDRAAHTCFTRSGYVSLRVDLMGTGNSDGLLTDEYSAQEIQDLEDVILFAGRSSWCSGSVGLLGFSWGAYSAMLVAMRRPPFLKAIISVMGSDDRFDECVHYNGGCLLSSNFLWASFMQIYSALPPDPAIVGEEWLDIWKNRLDAQPLWASQWLRHRTKDGYWRQGSVSADYSAIECPIHVFAGTADRYKETGFRLIENGRSFVKVTTGPWEHCYPHKAHAHPIDFPREALRWWDRWLKGLQTGVDDEPRITGWMGKSDGSGQWFATDASPNNSRPTILSLERNNDPSLPPSGGLDWVLSSQDGSERLPHVGEYIRLTSQVLTKPMELYGKPILQLAFAENYPDRQLVARLIEMRRDGRAIEISRGSQRFAALPQQLGASSDNGIELHIIARRIDAGSHLAVVLSTGLWPAIAPVPWTDGLDISFHGARLILPVCQSLQEARGPAVSGHNELSPATTVKIPSRRTVSVTEDPLHHEHVVRLSINAGFFGDFVRARFAEIETEIEHTFDVEYRIEKEGGSTLSAVRQDFKLERNDWKISASASFALASKADTHRLTGSLVANHGDTEVYRKDWPPEDIDAQ
jgi:uncharacterized protein